MAAVVVACVGGLALATGWSAAVARTGPRGEMLLSAAILAAFVAFGLGMPAMVPLVIASVTAFNLMFAFFLVWGLSSQGSIVGGIGALAALLAWIAAAIGTGMTLRGVSPLGMPALLLATLPVVTAVLLLREAATGLASAGASVTSSLWIVAMFLLPAALVIWSS
jgi:hypothetical protein